MPLTATPPTSNKISRSMTKALRSWHGDRPRKPLIIRGARQVGKTSLVEEFAREEGLKLVTLNLEQFSELRPIFDALKPDRLLTELALISGTKLHEGSRHLLFLDEIQSIPSAITMLRYLYESYPELAVVAAGSLLEFALSSQSISVPVGRIEYLHLGPVTFEECIAASGETELLTYLNEYELGEFLSPTAHSKLVQHYRQFLMVGGMPEAASEYLTNGDPMRVERIKASIINTYREDFSKYAKSVDLVRIRRVFDHVATSLGEKIKFSNIDPDSKSGDLKRCLSLLTMAQVVIKAYHSPCAGLPLLAHADIDIYKTYFLDCGLANHISGVFSPERGMLLDAHLLTEGGLAEQFVAQHLNYQTLPFREPSLAYWLRDKKQNNAEVDFVVEHRGQILPIEVKSGKAGSLRSLHQFILKTGAKQALRFDLNPPSRQPIRCAVSPSGEEIEFELISLPFYMIGQWQRLVGQRLVG